MKNRILKRVVGFVPILLIIGLVAALIYSVFYIGRLEEQIYGRDRIIQELSFRSNLVEEYFDIVHDSVVHTTSYTLKSSKSSHIILNKDSTALVIKKGDVSLSVDDLVKDYNLFMIEYNKLVNECNKAYKEIYNNKLQIDEMQAALDLVEQKYNIQYLAKRDSTSMMVTLTNTERLDSAIVLLPYYKYKVEEIEKHPNGYWVVHYITDSLSKPKIDNSINAKNR